ncbi:MAG TPA: class I SAM-dependent methyltransferase [Chloroflexia bacterium]|nr:class I SAM-dependent methyltransferase [Chloroflexia bacterium]
MAYREHEFYDDAEGFTGYMAHRANPANPNDTIEEPIFTEMLGAVAGLDILDLGCGDGTFGHGLLAAGCTSYCGLDASVNMVGTAQARLASTGGRGNVIHADIKQWTYPGAAFDLVISRLALHYIADEDISPLFSNVSATLRPGGRFVFSVLHPVFTSSARSLQESARHQDWIVDEYFVPGPRVFPWLGAQVTWHHRTVEDYVMALQGAGFTLTRLRESRPDPSQFFDQSEYERRRRIPLFLFLAGAKG